MSSRRGTTWLQQQRIDVFTISLVVMSWEVSFSNTTGGHFEDRYRVMVQKPHRFGDRLDTILYTEPTRDRAEAEATYQQICAGYATELARKVLDL